jgi:hypothetical protein
MHPHTQRPTTRSLRLRGERCPVYARRFCPPGLDAFLARVFQAPLPEDLHFRPRSWIEPARTARQRGTTLAADAVRAERRQIGPTRKALAIPRRRCAAAEARTGHA